ncbi:MAG: Nif3-like dinuclear metal center hexameric protein [Bacteroidota bacterium]
MKDKWQQLFANFTLYPLLSRKMLLSEITNYLNAEIPQALQESYDNCGLLIGNPWSEIKGILICLDVTQQVLDEAIEKKCNLVISHHPLIFSGIKSLTGRTDTERLVIRSIREDISIYAIHTNLDNHSDGVNRMLCSKLGIENAVILRPLPGILRKLVTFCPPSHAGRVKEAIFGAGAGQIGNYDSCSFHAPGEGTFRAQAGADPFVGEIGKLHTETELRIETIFPAYLEKDIVAALKQAHPYQEVAFDVYPLSNVHHHLGAGMIGDLPKAVEALEFLNQVKEILRLGCIRHTQLENKKIQRIALCGGSGSFLINEAMSCGAELYMTGDVKYHDFFIPENKMILADIGHYESEQFTKELIYTLLKKKFTTFALFISGTNTNPVNYL